MSSPARPCCTKASPDSNEGKALQVRLILAAGYAEPFACRRYARSDGSMVREYALTEADMEGVLDNRSIVMNFQIAYNEKTGRWQGELFNPKSIPLVNYRERVLFLLGESPVKP